MTVLDKIKNMTAEEMAKMFDNIDDVTCLACDPRYCDGYGDGINCSHENREKHCHNATVKWLQSEVE
jgi:hypothetical protein